MHAVISNMWIVSAGLIIIGFFGSVHSLKLSLWLILTYFVRYFTVASVKIIVNEAKSIVLMAYNNSVYYLLPLSTVWMHDWWQRKISTFTPFQWKNIVHNMFNNQLYIIQHESGDFSSTDFQDMKNLYNK